MTDNTKQTDALVIERVLDAPVDMIWKLWTEPEHFKQWYGPNGMQVPVAEMDLRVGGVRRVCMEMQTPDGTMQMWTLGAFTEIVINERLVYTEQYTDPEG
ncbi:MAG: SRPBCC domain-containing protein, partial [Chloroflexota bacterium]